MSQYYVFLVPSSLSTLCLFSMSMKLFTSLIFDIKTCPDSFSNLTPQVEGKIIKAVDPIHSLDIIHDDIRALLTKMVQFG